MKVTNYIFAGLFLFLLGCSPNLKLSEVHPWMNIPINRDVQEKKRFLKVIQPYKIKLDASMNQRISHTSVELNREGDNSNLGIVLSDYLFEGADVWAKKHSIEGVHAAILNIGGIRNNIAKGDVLIRHIFEVMPFENEMVIVKMKGEDVHEIFKYYEKTQKNNPVSGLYIETERGKLQKALISGEHPISNKYYYIATSDYLAKGGDSMFFFAKGEVIRTGVKLRDLFIEYFKKNPEIKVNSGIRLKFLK